MIYLQRVATEIKDVGLYDLVLQDVQKIVGKQHPTLDDVLKVLETDPQILEDYKQINVEYNVGNIHLDNIDEAKIEKNYQKCLINGKNNNLCILRKGYSDKKRPILKKS